MLKTDKFVLRMLVWGGTWITGTVLLAGGCLTLGALMYGATWVMNTVPEQADWFMLIIFLVGGMFLIAVLLSWSFAAIGSLPEQLEARMQHADTSCAKRKRKVNFNDA